MKVGLIGLLALTVALLGAAALGPARADAAQAQGGGLSDTTTCIDTTTDPDTTFECTVTVTRFFVENRVLMAAGTITNTATGALVATFEAPVQVVRGTCRILELHLGPLDLNVLGLQVDLSQIDLVITAQQGAGNLLGNLLCAVAGLLDQGSNTALSQLARLLNQILALL